MKETIAKHRMKPRVRAVVWSRKKKRGGGGCNAGGGGENLQYGKAEPGGEAKKYSITAWLKKTSDVDGNVSKDTMARRERPSDRKLGTLRARLRGGKGCCIAGPETVHA